MRPDEHKKKKNTAYKKKHGISNNNKDSDNTAADKKHKQKDPKNKAYGAKDDDASGSTNRNSQKVGGSAPNPNNSCGSGSDSDSEETVARKSYRRREIVSNWKKYDLEPGSEETQITSRGEDFNKLLNMTGEALSHFRFQEEREWEDDIRSGEGDSVEHDPLTSNFLNLDLADLSTSMACIPLHQLLRIEPALFPADKLESHVKSASEKRYSFVNQCGVIDSLQPKQKKEKSKTKTQVSDEMNQFKNDERMMSGVSTDKVNQNQNTPTPTDKSSTDCDKLFRTNETKDLPGDDVKHKSKEGGQVSPIKNYHTVSQPESSLGLMDNDLDQLLDMDVRHVETSPMTVSLDENMSGDGQAKATPTTKKDDKKEADELEDWLDSILD